VATTIAAGDLALGSHKITGVADPTNPQDAATKAYVDAQSQGLDIKPSVRAATVSGITLSGTQTVDGVAVVAGDRVLVKNQTSAAENGIYMVAAAAWSRSTDTNSSAKVTPGLFTFVEEGAVGADTGWVLTTDAPITLDTTELAFTQFSGAGAVVAGTGLVRTGTTIALDTGNGYGVRKAAADIGDGSSVAITVTHNLNTRDLCGVWLRDNSSPYGVFAADVEATTVNSVTIRFAVAPSAAQYRAVISG
jgi:phage-related tail fiber protein